MLCARWTAPPARCAAPGSASGASGMPWPCISSSPRCPLWLLELAPAWSAAPARCPPAGAGAEVHQQLAHVGIASRTPASISSSTRCAGASRSGVQRVAHQLHLDLQERSDCAIESCSSRAMNARSCEAASRSSGQAQVLHAPGQVGRERLQQRALGLADLAPGVEEEVDLAHQAVVQADGHRHQGLEAGLQAVGARCRRWLRGSGSRARPAGWQAAARHSPACRQCSACHRRRRAESEASIRNRWLPRRTSAARPSARAAAHPAGSPGESSRSVVAFATSAVTAVPAPPGARASPPARRSSGPRAPPGGAVHGLHRCSAMPLKPSASVPNSSLLIAAHARRQVAALDALGSLQSTDTGSSTNR